MKPLWGLGAAPSGLPWPDCASAVASAFASDGVSSEPFTPQPASVNASTEAAKTARTQLVISAKTRFDPRSIVDKSTSTLRMQHEARPLAEPTPSPNLAPGSFLFQAPRPGPRHFRDVLWRSSPIALPGFYGILNGKNRVNVL